MSMEFNSVFDFMRPIKDTWTSATHSRILENFQDSGANEIKTVSVFWKNCCDSFSNSLRFPGFQCQWGLILL